MSYVTRQQKDWIRMLYGEDSNHDDYQIMLEIFATLVEKTVLPAEQKTEIQRSKNPTRDFRERIALKDPQIKKIFQSIVDESQESGELKDEDRYYNLNWMQKTVLTGK